MAGQYVWLQSIQYAVQILRLHLKGTSICPSRGLLTVTRGVKSQGLPFQALHKGSNICNRHDGVEGGSTQELYWFPAFTVALEPLFMDYTGLAPDQIGSGRCCSFIDHVIQSVAVHTGSAHPEEDDF